MTYGLPDLMNAPDAIFARDKQIASEADRMEAAVIERVNWGQTPFKGQQLTIRGGGRLSFATADLAGTNLGDRLCVN